MLGGIAKYVGGKAVTALLVVVSAVVIIWYWQLAPQERAELWGMVRGVLIWLGFVAVLPWGTFFVPAMILRAENNVASAVMLLGYLALDAGLALYLTWGRTSNAWHIAVLLLGLLCAATYNFLVCDFLAERFEDQA